MSPLPPCPPGNKSDLAPTGLPHDPFFLSEFFVVQFASHKDAEARKGQFIVRGCFSAEFFYKWGKRESSPPMINKSAESAGRHFEAIAGLNLRKWAGIIP